MSNSSVRRVLRAVTQVATAASLVALAATTAHAQTPVTKDQPPAAGQGGGGGGGRNMMAAMMDSLNLTADQKTKVDSINTAFRGKMQAGGDRQAIMAERTTAIKAVLTADQAKKYDALMESMRGQMRPRP